MSLAIYFFSLLPIPFLICIAAVMYRRKQHVLYPIFWLYICFYGFTLPTEFICKAISYKAFFFTYWGMSFLAPVFKLLLLRDIFARTLRKYPELTRFRRFVYELSIVCLCCTAVALALRMIGTQSISRRIDIAELIVSCTAVFVFVFVAASSVVLGIKWKSAVSGMAAGLGLMGIADVVTFLILGWGPKLSQHLVLASWIRTLGFDAASGIFVFYFLPRRAEVEMPKSVKPELLEWAQSMKGSIPR